MGEDAAKWFNAVKIRLLAWIAVGITFPAIGIAGGLFASSISTALSDIKATQVTAATDQKTTATQVNSIQTSLAIVSTTVTEGLVKSVQGAVDVNVSQQGEINDLRDRVGAAEGDLKALKALQQVQLPSQGRR
jgi:hypothetical protein